LMCTEIIAYIHEHVLVCAAKLCFCNIC